MGLYLRHKYSTSRRSGAGAVWTCLLAAGFLGYAAWRSGMFFDARFYRWEVLLCALAAARLLARGMAGRYDGRVAGISYCKGPLAWTCVMALLYALALTGRPASVQATLEQVLRWSAYAAYLYLLAEAGRRRGFAAGWGPGLLLSGHAAVFGALAGWFGWLYVPDIVMRPADYGLSATGARLAGFFQYANMLGAVAGALLLWQWSLLVRGEGGCLLRLLARAGAVPYALALLLTESRGAWLATAAGWLLGLMLAAGRVQRRRWLLAGGWTMLLAGASYRFVYRIGAGFTGEGVWLASGGSGGNASAAALAQGKAASGGVLHRLPEYWAGPAGSVLHGVSEVLIGPAGAGAAAVIAASAACAAGLKLVERAALAGRRGALLAWLAPPLCALLLALLLPAALHGRVTGHFETGAARLLFYRDALALAAKAPLLGQGGGAWRALFHSVQSSPYAGSEVHSGYLDTLLNTGAVGLAALLVLAWSLCRVLWKRNRLILPAAVALLLHAAVDIDMSYGYYWLLLFGLAAAAPALEAERREARRVNANKSAAVRSVVSEGTAAAPRPGRMFARRAAALLAALWLAAASLGGWQLDRALRLREAAAAESGPALAALLRAAVEANPAWTRIRLDLAQLVPPGERAALLAAGLRYEPQSAPLQWELGAAYAELGDLPRATAALRAAERLDRFDSAKRTEAVQTLERLAQRQLAAGSAGEARQAALAALSLYAAYAQLDREVRGMDHPANDRRFVLTAGAADAASRCLTLLRQTARV